MPPLHSAADAPFDPLPAATADVVYYTLKWNFVEPVKTAQH